MSVLSSFPEVAHQKRREIIQLEAKRKYFKVSVTNGVQYEQQ